jgi:hypothetical protein
LQGAFLADHFVALLEAKGAFQVLDRSPLRKALYERQIIPESAFERAELEAARGTGAGDGKCLFFSQAMQILILAVRDFEFRTTPWCGSIFASSLRSLSK